MHIVVVGGNGFIGSHFVANAVDAGHRVTVVGRSRRPRFTHERAFEFFAGGLTGLANHRGLLGTADVICHFASTSIPATSNANPIADIEQNLMGTVELLEAMREVGTKRIVYLSSGGAVYGRPQVLPISEEHPLNPMSAYGISKMAIEKYLRMYAELYDFETFVVRPANPYGPGQGTFGQLGAVTTFINLALTGGTATVWGDGSVVRDFVYVSDLCRLLMRGIQDQATGTYNCGAGTGTSLANLISVVESVTGKTISKVFEPARPFDPPKIVLDISRAKTDLSWEPLVSLEQGIALTTQT